MPAQSKATLGSPQGDIIFLVGFEKVSIPASKCLLCAVSRPFAKMLGPYFKEGQDHDLSSAKEVLLPDDKPSAMEIMCDIIHHRNNKLPHALTAVELHDLAIVSDKYDCIEATSLAVKAWISPCPSDCASDLAALMMTAYMYSLPDAFHDVTKSLVLGVKGSFRILGHVPGFVEQLGVETMLALEENRALVRYELGNGLLAQEVGNSLCSWECPWSDQQLRNYFQALRLAKLLPVHNTANLSMMIERAASVPFQHTKQNGQYCSDTRWHSEYDVGMRKYTLNKVTNKAGLCLKCVESRIGGLETRCPSHSEDS